MRSVTQGREKVAKISKTNSLVKSFYEIKNW